MIVAAPASRAKERWICAQHPVRSTWGICWRRETQAVGRDREEGPAGAVKAINTWKTSQDDDKTREEGARGSVGKEVAGGTGSGEWWRQEGTSVGLVRFRVSSSAVIGLGFGRMSPGLLIAVAKVH